MHNAVHGVNAFSPVVALQLVYWAALILLSLLIEDSSQEQNFAQINEPLVLTAYGSTLALDHRPAEGLR